MRDDVDYRMISAEHRIISDESYLLPEPVYAQCVWIVRDIDRLRDVAKSEYDAPDVLIARKRIAAYNKAIRVVPREYREGILRNISDRVKPDMTASVSTWHRWKIKFLYALARNLALY